MKQYIVIVTRDAPGSDDITFEEYTGTLYNTYEECREEYFTAMYDPNVGLAWISHRRQEQ